MRLLFFKTCFFLQLTVAIKIEKIQISVTDNGKSSMNEKGGSSLKKSRCTSGGTRTRNPRFRRPMPYPLGHGGKASKLRVYCEFS